MAELDALQLNFNPAAQAVLKWVLALIMFGVALDLRWADFKRIAQSPKAPVIGLACQFLLMPAVAFALTLTLGLAPSLALGMILVAACPGGNLSNFLTGLSGGNAAVSVTMSAVSTVAAIIMTPLNLAFWGGLHPEAEPLLRSVALNSLDVLASVLVILIIPTILGMGFARIVPRLAERLKAPMRIGSMIIFLLFVVGAFVPNWENFIRYIHFTFLAVLLVNAAGFALGYGMAKFTGLAVADRKAVCFETGIQNSGFGLILALEFFPGLGGIALVAAWWGIWHIIAGLSLASWWRHRFLKATASSARAS